jgi:hypothetical protein
MNIIKKYCRNKLTIKPISAAQIINYDIGLVSNKFEKYNGEQINFENFLRIIIKQNMKHFKRIEILFNVDNVKQSVPLGYQFDMITENDIKYDSGTIVIFGSGIKSICSAELNMSTCNLLQINIRPNNGCLKLSDIEVIGYY